MRIINLTQHEAVTEQKADGVFEAPDRQRLARLLTFERCPDRAEILFRAEALAGIARETGAVAAMIGGAPYLMAPLEAALRGVGVKPVYAWSARVSVDVPQLDKKGEVKSVEKTQTFRHAGWVWA